MLLLEDKSIISQMNELSPEEQRNLIISYAKNKGYDIYFDVKKEKQKDKNSFHMLTKNGIILRRAEFTEYWSKKKWILWFLTNPGENRIQKDFGTIVYEFNKII